jgi:DnaK suppressor protein
MRQHLDARQLQELKTAMRDRARQLRDEILRTLQKSDSEQYAQIANDVRDLEDESFADLIVDVNLAEVDRDLEELRAVEDALRRIPEVDYGRCEDCSQGIEFDRLKATPSATRCFDCQTTFERTHFQRIGHTL